MVLFDRQTRLRHRPLALSAHGRKLLTAYSSTDETLSETVSPAPKNIWICMPPKRKLPLPRNTHAQQETDT
ncbi:hypothetical protein ACQKKX_17630 [Neorhizobium sp. NPDC001467]|uniref:hypothetical protein n=1 Tax=Neorhizobium sp. NPDC001467 TaxID=3390595 RepID=UPI003D0666EC